MTDARDLVELDVHPSVVFKLGEDLISDELQALVELIKNTYDADAGWARVTIDTSVETCATGVRVADRRTTGSHEQLIADAPSDEVLVGSITVEDDGIGMTPEVIREGWLVISNSRKRLMKRIGQRTAKKRTPLGDKGLGRLGAQRLGRELEIVTRPKGSQVQYRVRIPWNALADVTRLGQVSFPLITEAPTAGLKRGTRLTVYGLSDVALWQTRRDELTSELSTLVSPFPGHKDLDLTVRIDGSDLDLVVLDERLRNAADIRYGIRYADGELEVIGRASLEYFRPQREIERSDFATLVESDDGARLMRWYEKNPTRYVAPWDLRRKRAGTRTFFTYRMSVRLEELDRVARVDGLPADPGPFSGEIDAFSLDDDGSATFPTISTYRNYLKAIAGIRIYRNGFGIRMPEDWLGLGKRWSSGTSYYNLKPANVVGFVDLTTEDNAQLEEMTDREGFRSSPYLTNFMLLMERWRKFTEDVQGSLRRGYVDFRKETAQSNAGLDPDVSPSPEELAREMRSQLRQRAANQEKQRATVAKATATLDELDVLTETVVHDAASSDAARQQMGSVEDRVRQVRRSIAELTVAQSAQKAEAEREANLVSALEQQLEQVREQLAMSYEAVALGITAEALSHEVHQIADRLAQRTTQLRRRLSSTHALTPELADFLEYVRSQATTLNRQMSHLNPALRFARERRSRISVLPFLHDIADYYNQRWAAADLSRQLVAVVDSGSQDFVVMMNEGRLTQVVDNLVLNSEYWIRAQADRSPSAKRSRRRSEGLPLPLGGAGEIVLHCRPRTISIADNGPGVAPQVETRLLDPFVTEKRDGRGLGLFIVQQLLAADGGALRLDADRNVHGRRYRFTVDLSGVAE